VPRLFLAVRPPPAAVASIAELPRPDEPGVRWVPSDQWHITLRFLGESVLEDVVTALEGVDRLPRPHVGLGPRVSRHGRSVICLPAAGLVDVASFVEVATASIGEPPDARPFNGHLTLARLRHRGACRLAGQRVTIAFDARELELVASTLSSAGARHEVVHRWTLADPIR
jgi:2'-5' RNA ligase